MLQIDEKIGRNKIEKLSLAARKKTGDNPRVVVPGQYVQAD
jgi:hypothetical protein